MSEPVIARQRLRVVRLEVRTPGVVDAWLAQEIGSRADGDVVITAAAISFRGTPPALGDVVEVSIGDG